MYVNNDAGAAPGQMLGRQHCRARPSTGQHRLNRLISCSAGCALPSLAAAYRVPTSSTMGRWPQAEHNGLFAFGSA